MDDFVQYLAELRNKLSEVAEVSAEKDIAYGHQFTVLKDDEKVTLTAYNGKKGRKLVWGGSSGSLSAALQAAVNGEQVETQDSLQQKQFSGIWAGSDESGSEDQALRERGEDHKPGQQDHLPYLRKGQPQGHR